MMLDEKAPDLDRKEQKEILSYIPLQLIDQKNVLELAAGIGRYTSFFATHAHTVAANDLVPAFLEENQKQHSSFNNISYYPGDAVALVRSEWDSFFDFVFINWLFMYLSDEECVALIGKLNSWMRVGASLFSRESCDFSVSGRIQGICATYRSAEKYEAIFCSYGFQLLSSGNIKVYQRAYKNPNQRWWMWRKQDKPKSEIIQMTSSPALSPSAGSSSA